MYETGACEFINVHFDGFKLICALKKAERAIYWSHTWIFVSRINAKLI